MDTASGDCQTLSPYFIGGLSAQNRQYIYINISIGNIPLVMTLNYDFVVYNCKKRGQEENLKK